MYEIINGKQYDTEKAEKIASFWNGCGTNDFKNVEENLYKTKKGAYFIAGEGGAMSKYAESLANGMWSEGSHITPVNKEKAAEWCENTENYDIMRKEFEDLIEDA